jgi:succinyl-diaminopimelate desuccinylase
MPFDEKGILTTIEDLIRLRTVDGNRGQMHQAFEYIKSFFGNSQVHITEYNFNDYPALVITTKNTMRPKIFLQGHIDVVDGKDSQFEPVYKGEYLYGRGSVDMKSFDALAMHLVREAALKNPHLDIGLMLTFDEEVGGKNGAAKLAELGFWPQILINGDGGYNHAVIHAEKGILKIKLSASSNSNRHPYPWEGENAFDILVREYQKIRALFPSQALATDADNWYTTCSSYDVRVKNDALSAPHYAEMKINIYFTHDLAADQLYQKISKTVKQVELSKIAESERVYLPADNAFILELQQLMQENFKEDIVIRSENGSSDARFFTNKGIPILIVKVVGEGHHTDKEYLHIPSLKPLYIALQTFAVRYAKQNSYIKGFVVA